MLYCSSFYWMRHDIAGSFQTNVKLRDAIKRVHETKGYLLDPHSAIAYLGLHAYLKETSARVTGVFLATAHPAKFGEIVEPIIGRPIQTPAPLAEALARPRHILRIDASLDAVRNALGG